MGMNLRYSPLKYDRKTNRFDFGGGNVYNYSSNKPGLEFYVDPNNTTPGEGQSWAKSFDSIRTCLTYIKANYSTTERRNATVYCAPGDYDEGGTVAIDIQGLRLIGPGPDTQNKAMIYDGGSVGYDLMTIDNHEVVIDGMSLSAAGDTYDGIVISGTTSSYKVTIRNCRLDGWSGEYGVYASNDSPDLLIEDCLFRSWNTAAVYVNVTRGCVRRCIFHVVTDCIGIEHVPSGGNRPDNVYVDNYFSGVSNASTTGIKFTGAPSNGKCMCMKNYFAGTWDTSITQIAGSVGVRNYVADGSGGALIDTVS